MATTVEELAKEQAVLDAKLQRIEQEQQALRRSQADLRERQTRARDRPSRCLRIRHHGHRPNPITRRDRPSCLSLHLALKKGMNMATTVEELAKEQAVLDAKLQRIEQEQQALRRSQADLRERQTRARDRPSRCLRIRHHGHRPNPITRRDRPSCLSLYLALKKGMNMATTVEELAKEQAVLDAKLQRIEQEQQALRRSQADLRERQTQARDRPSRCLRIRHHGHRPNPITRRDRPSCLSLYLALKKGMNMATTVEELAKEQAVLDAKLQRIEQEQQALRRSQADLRERQTQARDRPSRCLRIRHHGHRPNPITRRDRPSCLSLHLALKKGMNMATTVEELAKEQAVLDAKLQRIEQEQQALRRSQADLRERQTQAEETDKRILDQSTFIQADDINRRFAELKADIDSLKNNRRWMITTFIACVNAISALVSLVVKLWE